MTIGKRDQEVITRDLARAIEILQVVQDKEFRALDPRAVAMAFVVWSSAIVKSSGGDKDTVEDMLAAAWAGELVGKVKL